MKPPTSAELTGQLEALLEGGTLGARARAQGEALLSQARAPLRVVVLGLAGRGKTQVANLLAGGKVLGAPLACPQIELCHGAQARTTYRFDDGRIETLDELPEGPPPPGGILSCVVEAPLDALKQFSLGETALGATQEERRGALMQAIEGADIAIWCSQDFDAEERALWQQVPDSKKDHAFFILTKADMLARTGALNARIEALRDVVAEEFLSMIPLATLQALEAQQAGDDAALSASGGTALLSAVRRQLRLGKRSYDDTILVFLNRFGTGARDDMAPDAPASPSPSSSSSPSRPSPSRRSDPAPGAAAARAGEQPSAEQPSADQPPPDPAPPDPAPAAPAPGPRADTPADRPAALVSRAIAYLDERTRLLARQAPDAEDTGEIVQTCVETSARLADMLAEADPAPGPLRTLAETAQESADVIVLMQFEDGPRPAADALCVLLQLRNDLQALRAA